MTYYLGGLRAVKILLQAMMRSLVFCALGIWLGANGWAQVSNTDVAQEVAASVLDPSRRLEAEYLLLKAKDAA